MAKKYIDADRLIEYLEKEADKEFKKTEENANSPVLCHFHNGCRMQALDTIDFINELQQEQPSEGLKGEIREWVNLMVGASFPEQDGDYISEEDYRSVIRQTALHFYELGKVEKEQPQLPSDVEEAANEIAYNMMPVAMITNCEDGHPDYDAWGALREKFIDGFKAGAGWQKEQMPSDEEMKCAFRMEYEKGVFDTKEQMLKDAVEGYVNYYEDGGGILMAEAQVGCPYHNGDKVKIIIVKED